MKIQLIKIIYYKFGRFTKITAIYLVEIVNNTVQQWRAVLFS